MKYIYLPLMRTNNALTIWLLATLMVLTASQASAQYTSKAITGNYEVASSWTGTQPPTSGDVNKALTIVANANITRNGDVVKKSTITLNGKLTVTGNYSETTWDALTINSTGEFVVNGNFSTLSALTVAGKLTVNGVATPNAGQTLTISSAATATFSNLIVSSNINVSGVLNVFDDLTLQNNQTLKINNGGKVEIWGDFNAISGSLDIQKGGVLIVHGNATLGNTGSTVQGDFVIAGDLTLNGGTVNKTGNIIVGGNFTGTNAFHILPTNAIDEVYFLNPNAIINGGANSDISSGDYGNMNSFLATEVSSLISTVSTVLGPTLSITPIWYSYASGDWNVSSTWTLDPKVTNPPLATLTVTNTDGSKTNITSSSDLPHVITSGKTVSIPSGAVVSTSKAITINSGGTLILAPGGHLTANGNITNNGTLTLQHTTSSPSSFINNGNIIGNITVSQILEGGRAWYIGSPMTYSASVLSSATPLNTGGTRSALEYNAATKTWSALVNSTPMKGFAVNLGTGGPFAVTQTGSLYNGAQQVGLVSGGDRWNLVANPFASYVTLVNPTNNIDHVTNPNWDFTNIEPTVYVRAKDVSAYKFLTFNLSTNVGSTGFENGLIAPMQSFWVRALASSSGSITVNKSARTHSVGAQSLKSAAVAIGTDILRIQTSNGNATDEAIIVFRAIGSDINTNIDSEKRADSPGLVPQIFTLKSSKNIAINVMPEDPTPYTIPLAITVGEKGAGDITLNASNIREFMPDVDVYVRDLVAGTEVNLRETPQYTFNTAAATAQTRFELYFAKKAQQSLGSVTGTEVTIGSGVVVTALGVGNKGIISVKDAAFSGEVSIDVYDAQGRLYQHYQSELARTEVDLSGIAQVVIVKVSYKDQMKSFKIMKSMRF